MVEEGGGGARARRAARPRRRRRTPSPSSRLSQPIVHVAFIPAIIVLGLLCTEPRPTLAQLLAPM